MTERDMPDAVPGWFRPQPNSPAVVYDSDTIMDIQRTLLCPMTGEMDDRTVSHIRGLQHVLGLRPTGVIDQETAVQIERLRNRYEQG